jgi:hypothetical protein
VQPARQARLREKHGTELARPDQADGHGTAGVLPFEQHGVEVHGSLGKEVTAHRARDENLGRHSGLFGARPSSSSFVGHSARLVSSVLPVWKPLPRQNVRAAVWQSGAILRRRAALAPGQRACVGQPDDSARRLLGGVPRLAAELVELSCASCMSDLNLLAPLRASGRTHQ